MGAINYVAEPTFPEDSKIFLNVTLNRVFSKVTTDSSKFARIENPNERLLKERPLGIKNQQANSLLE